MSEGAETEEEVAARVLREHRARQGAIEEAERLEGKLPGVSYVSDPPSNHVPVTHGAVEVDGEELMVPVGYVSLNAELHTLTNNFIVKMAAANGDRQWQAELSTEYLLTARELCLKMIG